MNEAEEERRELEAALEEMQTLVAGYPAISLAFQDGVDVGAHYIGRCLGVKPQPGEAPLPIIRRINAALKAVQPEPDSPDGRA